MTMLRVTLFVAVLSLALFASAQYQDVHSLQGPFTLPFWSVQGDAQITEGYIRLVEDRQNKLGTLWNVVPNVFDYWEATVAFRIHGISPKGADGLAFWYTENIDDGGSLFGKAELFRGIGVVVDTHDNDGTGMHPYVMLLSNDGTKVFDPEHEHGIHKEIPEDDEMQRGGCTLQVRNRDEPTVLRLTYFNNRFTVEASLDEAAFEPCIDVNLSLPPGYYFGFTAATGSLADNHDIHRFVVRALDNDGRPQEVPNCGEANSVGRALSKVQYELAETKKQIQLLLERLPEVIERPVEETKTELGPELMNALQANVDDMRLSVERTKQALQNQLQQVERNVVAAAKEEVVSAVSTNAPSEGTSWLTWLTCIVLLVTCVGIFYFQYQAHLHRKQKFF